MEYRSKTAEKLQNGVSKPKEKSAPKLDLKRMLDASGIKVEIHSRDSWFKSPFRRVLKWRTT
jgi:hypothetical protein